MKKNIYKYPNTLILDKRQVFLNILKDKNFINQPISKNKIYIDGTTKIINVGLKNELIYNLHHTTNGFAGVVNLVNYSGTGLNKIFYVSFKIGVDYEILDSKELAELNKEVKQITGN